MEETNRYQAPYALSEVSEVARDLLARHPGQRLFLLTGELGAGKTTLVKALCAELGVAEEVTSPTFSLVNEYLRADGSPVYHLDLYRIQDLDEAVGIGLEDYLYAPHYAFVEWPDIARPLLPEKHLSLHIQNLSGVQRKIVIL